MASIFDLGKDASVIVTNIQHLSFSWYTFEMAQLSVNVNKFALLRNSRGQNTPDVLAIARQCIAAGVVGITVHPRPDGRHIRRDDVTTLSPYLNDCGKEFNIEGYPSPDFVDMVCQVAPTQVTLVPDPPEALTSSFGWDIQAHQVFLKDVIERFRRHGIRTSIFVDPTLSDWQPLTWIMPDRVELFTYDYAHQFPQNPEGAIAPYRKAATVISKLGIGLNAGHDLSLENLKFFVTQIPEILEVSIGHALVCESLQSGLGQILSKYMYILR